MEATKTGKRSKINAGETSALRCMAESIRWIAREIEAGKTTFLDLPIPVVLRNLATSLDKQTDSLRQIG